MRTLRANGVVLEPQVAGHAAELYAVLRDPSLYAFTDAKEPESEDWLRQRLKRLESRQSPDGTQLWLNWVVRDAAGSVVGYVQATVDTGASAEIAYVIGRSYWRQGYGTAATSAMLEELALNYGVRRCIARLDPRNAGSMALLGKLGFARVDEDVTAAEVVYAR